MNSTHKTRSICPSPSTQWRVSRYQHSFSGKNSLSPYVSSPLYAKGRCQLENNLHTEEKTGFCLHFRCLECRTKIFKAVNNLPTVLKERMSHPFILCGMQNDGCLLQKICKQWENCLERFDNLFEKNVEVNGCRGVLICAQCRTYRWHFHFLRCMQTQ